MTLISPPDPLDLYLGRLVKDLLKNGCEVTISQGQPERPDVVRARVSRYWGGKEMCVERRLRELEMRGEVGALVQAENDSDDIRAKL